MKKTIAALVVATAAAGFTVARADQGEDNGFGGHHGRRGPSQAQLLEKYDANHNGVLDPEEKAAAKADWEAHRKEREAKCPRARDRRRPSRHTPHAHCTTTSPTGDRAVRPTTDRSCATSYADQD